MRKEKNFICFALVKILHLQWDTLMGEDVRGHFAGEHLFKNGARPRAFDVKSWEINQKDIKDE